MEYPSNRIGTRRQSRSCSFSPPFGPAPSGVVPFGHQQDEPAVKPEVLGVGSPPLFSARPFPIADSIPYFSISFRSTSRGSFLFGNAAGDVPVVAVPEVARGDQLDDGFWVKRLRICRPSLCPSSRFLLSATVEKMGVDLGSTPESPFRNLDWQPLQWRKRMRAVRNRRTGLKGPALPLTSEAATANAECTLHCFLQCTRAIHSTRAKNLRLITRLMQGRTSGVRRQNAVSSGASPEAAT
jgi:hypothetical protein